MSTRILFVDDDANVLRGLRRAMFEMSDEWEMAFANSGKDALSTLEKEGFDVIVSDMRMPEMDGAELLQEVSRRYPHMVRIILSGQADKEAIIKSVQPTHQYLAKPCDIRQLNEIVAQSVTVLVWWRTASFDRSSPGSNPFRVCRLCTRKSCGKCRGLTSSWDELARSFLEMLA
ncbi:MAG: response regulator [bacterium]